ncbi:hypothetical protein [Roseateles sp. PN1]|uniref:hypothetical protein n=1 Tax=Roseateles sp. PN1 TaxID=3137372 RepID=UPI003139A98A
MTDYNPPDVEDLAHGCVQEALSFGLSHDVIARFGRDIMKRTEEAMKAYADQSALAVWYGPMPETNGKSNFTAILHRGDLADGHTIARSEYPDRVRFYADSVRHLIGELSERPDVLAYDDKLHSGYVAPKPAASAYRVKTKGGKSYLVDGPPSQQDLAQIADMGDTVELLVNAV